MVPKSFASAAYDAQLAPQYQLKLAFLETCGKLWLQSVQVTSFLVPGQIEVTKLGHGNSEICEKNLNRQLTSSSRTYPKTWASITAPSIFLTNFNLNKYPLPVKSHPWGTRQMLTKWQMSSGQQRSQKGPGFNSYSFQTFYKRTCLFLVGVSALVKK